MRRRSFFVTANTPSTVLSSASSAIVVTPRVYGRKAVGTLAAMADVQPFRAVRYSGAAGSLADLVAPPYDAVDDDERAELYTRSPYNVVHVTLPESVERGGSALPGVACRGHSRARRRARGLARGRAYVGPDGVVARAPRRRSSRSPRSRTRPAPSSRTSGRIRGSETSDSRLLRATRVQPEPILAARRRGPSASRRRRAQPDLEVDGTRLWRDSGAAGTSTRASSSSPTATIATRAPSSSAPKPARAERGSWRSSCRRTTPGLHVFPTHRVFAGRPDLEELREGEPCGDLDEALLRLDERAVRALRP